MPELKKPTRRSGAKLLAKPHPNKKNYLNIGCGNNPVESTDQVNVFNVDMGVKKDKRIVRFDISKFPYPYEAGFFDRIYMFHTIEHIDKGNHGELLNELRRILKDSGELVLAYPEFSKVAKNWLEDTDGQREFWEKTIYGRSRNDWDRHVCIMDTLEFSKFALRIGFTVVAAVPEKSQDFNTVAILAKCEPTLTYEELMGNEFHLKQEKSG